MSSSSSRGVQSIQLEDGSEDDRYELPGQPYALALWNLIIRPPRRRYDLARLGPSQFRLWSVCVKRVDVDIRNARGMTLKCSHFLPLGLAEGDRGAEPRPVVIYLHQNASCRLEALRLVPLFLPLGISLFCFDFAGCGESDGEYISLGWYERDDLAEVVDYLRKTGKVSAIGLWGRSMGAVTALLHADRDHSIGGMVLDSPFCNLTTLASELAQSEYLAVKVPSWLLSGALALGRMRIQSLCGFDIDRLTPEQHVGDSFIPALFIHGKQDDFIGPHHTEKLYGAYTGDKELELVEGDHNSSRPSALNRKAVIFFCRAFRTSTVPQGDSVGSLSKMLGLDTLGLDGSFDQPVMSRQLILEAGKQLALHGSAPRTRTGPHRVARPSLGDRHQVFLPFRAEGALQLCETTSEAGFCICAVPVPSEWGGVSRPPEVLLVYISASGLHVARATERGREVLAHVSASMDLSVPLLCIMEIESNPSRLMFTLGTGGPALKYKLREECGPEVFVWLWDSRSGDTLFFDCAFSDISRRRASAAPSTSPDPSSLGDSEETLDTEVEVRGERQTTAGGVQGSPNGRRAPDGAPARQRPPPAPAEDSGYCQTQ